MNIQPYIFIAAGVVIIMLTLFRHVMVRKKKSMERSAYIKNAAVRQKDEEGRDMLVRLESAGREITAKLDMKIRVLEQLIREADDKISELRSHTSANKQDAPETPRPEKKPLSLEERYEKIYALADRGIDSGAIARQCRMFKGEVELILGLRANKNRYPSSEKNRT